MFTKTGSLGETGRAGGHCPVPTSSGAVVGGRARAMLPAADLGLHSASDAAPWQGRTRDAATHGHGHTLTPESFPTDHVDITWALDPRTGDFRGTRHQWAQEWVRISTPRASSWLLVHGGCVGTKGSAVSRSKVHSQWAPGHGPSQQALSIPQICDWNRNNRGSQKPYWVSGRLGKSHRSVVSQVKGPGLLPVGYAQPESNHE